MTPDDAPWPGAKQHRCGAVRLAHRHGEITGLFGQIKAGVEETMQAMGEDEEESEETPMP